jgi:hypothetical protein
MTLSRRDEPPPPGPVARVVGARRHGQGQLSAGSARSELNAPRSSCAHRRPMVATRCAGIPTRTTGPASHRWDACGLLISSIPTHARRVVRAAHHAHSQAPPAQRHRAALDRRDARRRAAVPRRVNDSREPATLAIAVERNLAAKPLRHRPSRRRHARRRLSITATRRRDVDNERDILAMAQLMSLSVVLWAQRDRWCSQSSGISGCDDQARQDRLGSRPRSPRLVAARARAPLHPNRSCPPKVWITLLTGSELSSLTRGTVLPCKFMLVLLTFGVA